jgi:hypothetical protein
MPQPGPIPPRPPPDLGLLCGNIGGEAFHARSAVAYYDELWNGGHGLRVILSSAGAGKYGATDCTWYFPTASSKEVWIEIPDNQVEPEMRLSASALARLWLNTPDCSSMTHDDAGGSMTLSLRDGTVSGSLDLSFASGAVTGSFGVTLCGAPPGWALTCQ